MLMSFLLRASLWISLLIASLGFMSASAWAQINPQIRLSRDSGVAPLGVFFDAEGTTSSLTNQPYHDLTYSWDFGDQLAGSWSTDGKSRNKATGPIAGHLFQRSGTFTVTLTVTDTNGNEAHRTETITVSDPDPNKIICISPSDFDGCPVPSSNRRAATSNLASQVSSLLNEGFRTIMLRGGETFSTSGTIKLNRAGPGALTSFGPGDERAKISASQSVVMFKAKSPDWRVYDLIVEGSGASTDQNRLILNDQVSTHQLTFHNVKAVENSFYKGFVLEQNTLANPDDVLSSQIFVTECNIKGVGPNSNRHNVLFSALRDSAILGNSFARGAHIIRIQHGEDIVIANNQLEEQKHNLHILTIRSLKESQGEPGGADTDYWTQSIYIADNTMLASSIITLQVASETNQGRSKARDVIIERNFLAQHPDYNDKVQVDIKVNDTIRATVRNNIVGCNLNNKIRGGYQSIKIDPNLAAAPGVPAVVVANNTVCDLDPGNQRSRGVRVKSGPGLVLAHNNLLYAPDAGVIEAVQNENSQATVSNNLATRSNPFAASRPGHEPIDYELAPFSAPIDQGLNLARVRFDFFKNIRSSNETYDIGAHEFGATGSSSDGFRLSANDDTPQSGQTLILRAEGGLEGVPFMMRIRLGNGTPIPFHYGVFDQNGEGRFSIFIESSMPTGVVIVDAVTILNGEIAASDALALTFN